MDTRVGFRGYQQIGREEISIFPALTLPTYKKKDEPQGAW